MSAGVSSDQRMKGQGNQGMFGPSFGQQSSSPSYNNYFPGNGDFNTWSSSQQVNAGTGQQQQHPQQQQQHPRNYNNYNSSSGNQPHQQRSSSNDDTVYERDGSGGGIKHVEQGMQGISLSAGGRPSTATAHKAASHKPDPPKDAAPKQMTWASIASQPAKPQIRTNSSTSILKKKGPGMPPPPMVPGKHNMDINNWDSPKNGPALVPPPLPMPIVIPAPVTNEPSPLSNSHPLNQPHKHHHQQQQQQQQHHYPTPQYPGPARTGDRIEGDYRTAVGLVTTRNERDLTRPERDSYQRSSNAAPLPSMAARQQPAAWSSASQMAAAASSPPSGAPIAAPVANNAPPAIQRGPAMPLPVLHPAQSIVRGEPREERGLINHPPPAMQSSHSQPRSMVNYRDHQHISQRDQHSYSHVESRANNQYHHGGERMSAPLQPLVRGPVREVSPPPPQQSPAMKQQPPALKQPLQQQQPAPKQPLQQQQLQHQPLQQQQHHQHQPLQQTHSSAEISPPAPAPLSMSSSSSSAAPAHIIAKPPATAPVEYHDESSNSSQADHPEAVLEELCVKNDYNPQDFDFETCKEARFFVIKSYSEDDIHRSIKYEIWCSTDHGNRRLDQAFHERDKAGGVVYLLFSVNGSGHFCGMAQMLTAVDYNSVSSVWSQSKWKGTFKVKWIYVKDVPNSVVRHIRLENNENKSVTNSRDTQEVPNVQGIMVLDIISTFKHVTSIFDDFVHYEKRQEEEDTKKVVVDYDGPAGNNKYGGGGGYDRGGSYGGGGGGGYDRNKGFGGPSTYSRGGGYSGSYDNRRGDEYQRGGGGGGYSDRSVGRDNDYYQRDRDIGGGGGGGGFNRNNRGNDYRGDRRNDDRGFMSRDRDNNDGGGGGDRVFNNSQTFQRGGGGGFYRGGEQPRNDDYNNDKYNN